MATVDDKEFVDKLIANDGHYDDDPQLLQIASYRTPEGKTAYSLAWTERDVQALYSSPFCSDIRVIWQRPEPDDECGNEER